MKRPFLRLSFKGRYTNREIVPLDVNLSDYFEEGEIVELRMEERPAEPPESGGGQNEKLE